MKRPLIPIDLFVSSPNEQSENREIVAEICNELNRVRGEREGFIIRAIRWETRARPGAGLSAQEVINRQLGTDFDVYVGLMGSRFGTPTNRAGSGTEEEFENALDNHANKRLTELLFYFQDPRFSGEKINASELAKIEAFQNKLRDSGVLYWDFESSEQFKNLFTLHLSDAIDTVLTQEPRKDFDSDSDLQKKFDPLENLNQLEDYDDEGLIELEEKAVENTELFVAEMTTVGDNTEILGSKFVELTKQVDEITSMPRETIIKNRGRLINLTSKYLEDYTRSLANSLPKLHEYFGTSMDATNSMVLAIDQYEASTEDEFDFLDRTLAEIGEKLDEVSPMVEKFRTAISTFPKLSKTLSRSKRRMLAVLADLLAFFQQSKAQISNLREQIKIAKNKEG